MNYNYVVLGSGNDYYMTSYADLLEREDVKYLWKQIDTNNKLITLFYKLHTSPLSNKYFNLPLKKIWNKWVFRGHFSDDKPICFILFTCRDREINNGLLSYLRKKYYNCKIVLFYQDLVKKSKISNIDDIKNDFDLILSFDQDDVKKYNLTYYPLVYSMVNIPANPQIESSDIYFVGKAKDRLDKIIETFEKFKNAGLKCDFHIVGVDKKNQTYSDEIVYNEPVPYIENIQRIKASKCMLEIMQQGGHGYTLRYCEAIMFNRKIITDNMEIDRAPFFSSDKIQVFKDVDDIDISFVKQLPVDVDYKYKQKLSPLNLLEYIDKYFQD